MHGKSPATQSSARRTRAPKRSRIDAILDNMDAFVPGKSLNIDDFLASSKQRLTGDDDRDADDMHDGDSQPCSVTPTRPTQPYIDSAPTAISVAAAVPMSLSRTSSQSASQRSLHHSQLEDALSGASPLVLSELGMRQRREGQLLEALLHAAESVSLSRDPVDALTRLLHELTASDGRHRASADATLAGTVKRLRLHGDLSQFIAHLCAPIKEEVIRSAPPAVAAALGTVTFVRLCLLAVVLHYSPPELQSRHDTFAFVVSALKNEANTSKHSAATTNGQTLSELDTTSPVPVDNKKTPKGASHWSMILNATSPRENESKTSPQRAGNTQQSAVAVQQLWEALGALLATISDSSSTFHPLAKITALAVPPEVTLQRERICLCSKLLCSILVAFNREHMNASAAGALPSIGGHFFVPEDGDGDSVSGGASSSSLLLMPARSASSITPPGAVLFEQSGGLDVCVELLTRYSLEPSSPASLEGVAALVSLLEIATCSDGVAQSDFGRNVDVLAELLRVVTQMLQQEHTERNPTPLQRQMIRVCTNISTLCHAAVPQSALNVDKIASFFSNLLRAQAAGSVSGRARQWDYDFAGSIVCLLVNYLDRGRNDNLRWALIEVQSPLHTAVGSSGTTEPMSKSFLDWLCFWMPRLYEGSDKGPVAATESNAAVDAPFEEDSTSAVVLAGYFALLIALLSRFDDDARVAVVTSLTRHAAAEAQQSLKVQQRPLTFVVAILQEFVMFQSKAQVLTKEMLVALHDVIEGLIAENGIPIEA